MVAEIGEISRREYCENIIVSASQQIRKLKEKKVIYCQTGNCSEKGRVFKQNEKRRLEKEE